MVGDGEAALRYLRGEADPVLQHGPAIVLTTTAGEVDILRSYQLQATAYVTKPVTFGDFLDALTRLEGSWL